MKKVLSLVLALCLCLTLLPAVALAADGVDYFDFEGGTQIKTCTDYTVITSSSSDITWSVSENPTWYVVSSDVTINGTLNIPASTGSSNHFHLILCDGATLTVTGGIKGGDASLTVYAGNTTGSAIQGTGRLIVTGAAHYSYYDVGVNLKNLTVNGGEVTVNTHNSTAENSYGFLLHGNLTVRGGKLTATCGDVNVSGENDSGVYGSSRGALIQGDLEVSGNGTLTVTGGEVNVNGESHDTVSGSSYGARIDGKVEVSGNGKLTATGSAVTVSGKDAYAVKGESYGLSIGGTSSTISGGTLKATASDVSVARTDGSAIYGRSESVGIYRYSGGTTISGGAVELAHGTATLTGSESSDTFAYDLYMDTGSTKYLTVSGGTMKLRESLIAATISASGPVTLADLLAEGYAYWMNGQFVKLSDLTSTPPIELKEVSIKPCEHSLVGGVCEYCGQESADGLAWLLPVIGALDKEPFDDVKSGDWFYDDVNYVNEYGLMTGTGSRTFSPDAPVTRGMVMTILARREGIMTDRYSPWYAAGVEWAVANGISDGTNPEAEITREELATMLYRYAQLKGYDVSVGADTNILSFLDTLEISDYAFEPLQWAVGSGLMNGSNGRLTPRDTATRAQLAAMLHRFFG